MQGVTRAPLSFGSRDLVNRTPWAVTSAAQKVRSQSRNALTRTLCIESRSPASVRRASTRTDGHLMMGCGRERRAAANERLQHSGATQPPLSTQRAASCAHEELDTTQDVIDIIGGRRPFGHGALYSLLLAKWATGLASANTASRCAPHPATATTVIRGIIRRRAQSSRCRALPSLCSGADRSGI